MHEILLFNTTQISSSRQCGRSLFMFYAFLQSVNVCFNALSQTFQGGGSFFLLCHDYNRWRVLFKHEVRFLSPSYYFLPPELSHLLVTWLINGLVHLQIPSLPFATFIIPNCHNVIYLFTRMIYIAAKNCSFLYGYGKY